MKKITLRAISHMACTGGTVISKCLAAMPNTFVFSEVHPNSTLHLTNDMRYCPSDITTLARYAKIPNIEELAIKIFLNNIKLSINHLSRFDSRLVLRLHSHFDYCHYSNDYKSTPLENTLSNHYKLKNAITVRNPIESYISLTKNKWVTFEPTSFDEYCRRYIKFLNNNANSKVFKYEEFADNPIKFMKEICFYLDIPFDPSFTEKFYNYAMTGDSGRKSSLISSRESKQVPESLQKESCESFYYHKLINLLGY